MSRNQSIPPVHSAPEGLPWGFVHRLMLPALLLFNMVSIAMGAEVSLVPDPVSVQPGETVWVAVMADFQDEATLGGGMDIAFDPGLFQFVSYSENGIGDPQYQRDPDPETGMLAGAAFGSFIPGYDGSEQIATVVFTVQPDAPEGLSSITIGASSGIAGPFASAVDNLQQSVTFVSAQINILPSCSYSLTSPNGGESWNIGSVQAVRWQSNGSQCGSNVKIELFKGGVLEATLATSTPDDGVYTWVIAGITPGPDYTVRVTDLGNSAWTDESDSVFNIINDPGFIFSSSYE